MLVRVPCHLFFLFFSSSNHGYSFWEIGFPDTQDDPAQAHLKNRTREPRTRRESTEYGNFYGNFDFVFDHSHAFIDFTPPHTIWLYALSQCLS